MCARPLLLSYPLLVRCLNTGTGTQTTKKHGLALSGSRISSFFSVFLLLRHQRHLLFQHTGLKSRGPSKRTPHSHQISCIEEGV
ncbi:hypothetical protein V8C34DRAFT_266979 [Trichoderma compactum]